MNTFASILADTGRWNHMDGWGGGWMWLWGTLMMAGFIALGIWLARGANRSNGLPPVGPANDPNDRARQIVAERYANGDITTEDYREQLAELDQTHSR